MTPTTRSRRGELPPTDNRLRMLPAVLVVGAAGLFACASDDVTPAAGEIAGSSSETISSTPDASSAASSSAPTSSVGSTLASDDAATRVAAAFEAFAEAMERADVDALIERTSGPARVFQERARHFGATSAIDDLFPNVQWEMSEVTVSDDAHAVVDGTIVWGSDEPSTRETTEFEFRRVGERWLLDSFLRDGDPIGKWVTPGSDTPVTSGPVTVELVSTFTDLSCMPGVESACPADLRNSISLDVLVDNRSEGDLQPGSLSLPDGAQSPAWLETPSGGVYPLRDSVVAGFPPLTTVPVIGRFDAADDLADGGVLHVALVTADGTDRRLDVPVAPYPYVWTDQS